LEGGAISDSGNELPNLIDRSVKALFRECPTAVLRLAGREVVAEAIRVEDPNLNLPEPRADHVFVMDADEHAPAHAIYLEYQLEPDTSLLSSWCAKWGGLTRQLGMPVILLALYLQRRNRATFPDRMLVQGSGMETELRFTAIRLWEHAGRIRSGELPELAPLLVLCEDSPTPETVREEVALIHASRLSVETQSELLGIALLVATRQFSREVLRPIFEGDWNMMKGLDILDDFLIATGRAEELRTEGEVRGVRDTLLRLGRKRFGEPQAHALEALESISSVETLQEMAERLLVVESWEELTASV
jgi:hypothetical protein